MKNKSIRILCAAVLCLAVLFSLTAFGTTASASAGPETYTIRFDLNTTNDPADDELYRYEESGYDENWQPVTTEKEAVFEVPAGDDAYLDVSLPDPVRDGYYFAGWQTRPNVTEADLVNGVSPYLWLMGQKLSFVVPTATAPFMRAGWSSRRSPRRKSCARSPMTCTGPMN